ncbi:MAG: hypothetical protein NVV66_00110 [Cellulomonas sp.]|uniref:hypothetical protein n=1 Tax=Cellulomonas sp. TaxID=40001 RepID=UPI002585E591|nr:hypothetical protein [Cellulomonas sp.]MCR6703157.1 hypothetical protein [Cellulomonas sp.]
MAGADLAATVVLAAGGAELELGDAPYVVESLAVPGRTWRRSTVEGRYQHGRAVLGVVLDTATISLDVRVEAATWTAQQDAYESLLSLVSRRVFTLTTNIEGHVEIWTCEPADVALANGDLEKHLVMAGMQTYRLTIPAVPVPEHPSGPM